MITLIIQLCAVCAAGSILEMASNGTKYMNSLRFICGLIMLSITISGIKDIAQGLSDQKEFLEIFDYLAR